jgi:hypothetical protein
MDAGVSSAGAQGGYPFLGGEFAQRFLKVVLYRATRWLALPAVVRLSVVANT